MVNDLVAILLIRDRTREFQLLERCLRLEQLTFRQIGARLGMPETTAQYRYRRACGPR